ncbi:MAG: ATP-binding cassette domain-containing protein, partial [Angustibacter sp.]
MPLADASLELREVSVGYDRRTPIVHSVSLRVGPRDVLALLGSNGSGKTTLVRGILGLAPVLAGEILVGGRPLTQSADRARIGYVPQRHTVSQSVPATVTEVV